MRKTHCIACNCILNEGDTALQKPGYTGFFCGYECYAKFFEAEHVLVSEDNVKENEYAGSYGWDEE